MRSHRTSTALIALVAVTAVSAPAAAQAPLAQSMTAIPLASAMAVRRRHTRLRHTAFHWASGRQKSIRTTARRSVGRLTSVKPAAANVASVPG